MNVLDLTMPTPAENLALDEAMLDSAESGQGGEMLRFWESPRPFVVVGYANKIDLEVNRSACCAAGVPIYRRCSGGGTVVQGPGCLNYSLVLEIAKWPLLATIPQTNTFIMERQAAALRTLGIGDVQVEGHTDLAVNGVKFSGNAQRRKRDYVLFHGTFLLNFDLGLISTLLTMPSKEPEYRAGRTHDKFVQNLGASEARVKDVIRSAWNASDNKTKPPVISIELLAKYNSAEWNFKF